MPAPVSVHCPACNAKLKISDPKLFGKKVKCPGCQKPFLVQVPSAVEEEVELSLVESDNIPTGTGARIVPDQPVFPGPPASNPVAPTTAPSSFPDLGSPQPTPTVSTSSPTAPLPFEPESTASGSSSALDRLKKKRKKGNAITYAVIIGVLLIMGGGVAYVIATNKPVENPASSDPVAVTHSGTSTSTDNEPYSQAKLEGDASLVAGFDPTDGEPIPLLMMPSGVNLIIHLRPALLWSEGYDYQVLRAALTEEVTNWIAGQMQAICRREPSQIEEATIGIILGARGSEPDICAVVRLKEPAKLSDLIDEFPGTYLYDLAEKPDLRLKVDGTHGYLIKDASTFAICPERLASELEFWVDTPNYEVTEGMSDLLSMTDRQRLFTIVGESGDIRRHIKSLFPEPSQQSATQIFQWLGEELETVSWSAHVDPYLHSEVKLRPPNTINSIRVRDRINDQLEELPKVMWKDVCLKMQPKELRFREFIGRLPAMLEAFQRSTVSSTGARHVSLTTVLPAKAAPNLALAALFTANEAAQTDFSADVVVASTTKKDDLPETVAERMKLPVDAEFNRTPLEPALQYLADEIKVNLFVDGDGLKDAGYTKNMPQTFNLGKVPMIDALAEIVNAYQEANKEMVVSVDEGKKLITVTTKKFAEKQGLPIFPIPKSE